MRRRRLGLHTEHQFAAGAAQALSQLGPRTFRTAHGVGAQQDLAPDPADKVTHEGRYGDVFQIARQAQRIQIAQALLVFFFAQQLGHLALALDLGLSLFGHEGFQRLELGFVDLDLVEVTFHHFVDQCLDLGQEALCTGFIEVFE